MFDKIGDVMTRGFTQGRAEFSARLALIRDAVVEDETGTRYQDRSDDALRIYLNGRYSRRRRGISWTRAAAAERLGFTGFTTSHWFSLDDSRL